MSPTYRWRCRDCLSDNVQVLDWVDANSNAFVGDGENHDAREKTWCEPCSENTGLIWADNKGNKP